MKQIKSINYVSSSTFLQHYSISFFTQHHNQQVHSLLFIYIVFIILLKFKQVFKYPSMLSLIFLMKLLSSFNSSKLKLLIFIYNFEYYFLVLRFHSMFLKTIFQCYCSNLSNQINFFFIFFYWRYFIYCSFRSNFICLLIVLI